MHVFSESLSKEKEESKKIDAILSSEYYVLEAPLELDKKGIDRVLVHKETLETTTIDYKHDWRASETGNAFIEICSVRKNGKCEKRGWVYNRGAEDIFYNVVGEKTIFIIPKSSLVMMADVEWDNKYRKAVARNPGYVSEGILVPLFEIEAISTSVIQYGKMSKNEHYYDHYWKPVLPESYRKEEN